MTPKLRAALQYANLGIRVFPVWFVVNRRCGCGDLDCASPGKHPMTGNGFKNATSNPEIIRQTWGKAPEPNIGAATGGDFIVLDEDRPGALLAAGIELPNAPTQRTGRGLHWVFKANGKPIPSRNGFAPGLDVKGEGGFVVLAPSTHISGRSYEWVPGHSLEDLERPYLPSHAEELILKPGSNGSAEKGNGYDLFGRVQLERMLEEIERLPRDAGGVWRDRVLRLVGSLIARGAPDYLIYAVCRRATWLDAGYSHADTDADVAPLIESTRRSWDRPEPEVDAFTFGKVDGEVDEDDVPDPKTLCTTPAQWAARKIPPEDLLLGDLYSTTRRSLLSADTGLGKTLIGMASTVAMGLGVDFLHWRAGRRALVVYVDGEMPAGLIQERLALALSWFGVEEMPDAGIHVVSKEDVKAMPPLDTPEGMQWMLAFLGKFGQPGHVTFDNIAALTTACLKEEDGARALQKLQHALTAQNTGQLWLHHTGLDTTRAYGPKLREWHLDTVMVAEKKSRPDTDVSFTLRFPKARRRTPTNRADFEEADIALVNGVWVSSSASAFRKREPSPNAKICLNALHKALTDLGGSPPYSSMTAGVTTAVKVDDWRHVYNLMAPHDDSDSRSKAWCRGVEWLLSNSFIKKWGEWVWLS
jgi:Bifunctional DNA primase/polymerase, N-terminal/AAA domain